MQKFFDYGIDLGTTNSCIAKPTDDNGFSVIENTADRMNVTPSAVSEDRRGRLFYGQRAYNSIDIDNVAIQFKRWMGTDTSKVFGSGREMNAIELSAEILKSLKRDAETRYGEAAQDVVITVPAAFSSLQCTATNEAAKAAGFRNVELLQEPIAAAIAYGVKPDAKDKYWMVFDYGGGTLDVAIVSTHDGRLSVVNCEGDNYCGGSDINQLMYDQIIKPRLEEEYDISNFSTGMIRNIVLSLEKCKIELSSAMESICEIFEIQDANGEDIEFEYTIKRQELENLIRDTVDNCIKIAKKAVEGSGVPQNKIDRILLVGGSTFIPLVRQKLKEAFADIPQDCSCDPMTVVAGGAAIYASSRIVEVADEAEQSDSEQPIIKAQYDAKSSEDSVNIIGTIENAQNYNLDKIKVDAVESENGGAIWTSGWIEFADRTIGYFDVDVMLNRKNGLNSFKFTVCDKKGTEIKCVNDTFAIRHNETVLKNSSAPVNNSVCILASNGEYNVLKPVIKKNTPLPAEFTEEFYTNKALIPENDDVLEINIYEGEEWDNPPANEWIHCVKIYAKDIGKTIPAGTKIEITMLQNESRINKFSGYIPDIDFVLDAKELGKTEYKALEDKMDEVHKYLQEVQATIRMLKQNGVDVDDFEKTLASYQNDYDGIYKLIGEDNDKVNLYMRGFYDFYSQVLQCERDHLSQFKNQDAREQIESIEDDIQQFGGSSEKSQLSDLKDSYSKAKNDEDKKCYLDEMNKLAFDTKTNNFEFLARFYLAVLAGDNADYTNGQQASYWKGEAESAISERNTPKLRNAVFKLLDLMVGTANGSATNILSDLRI